MNNICIIFYQCNYSAMKYMKTSVFKTKITREIEKSVEVLLSQSQAVSAMFCSLHHLKTTCAAAHTNTNISKYRVLENLCSFEHHTQIQQKLFYYEKPVKLLQLDTIATLCHICWFR